MKKTNKLSAIIANAKLTKKAVGPEFTLGFGLGLIAAGFIMAIKATKKPAKEIHEAEDELVYLHEHKENIQFREGSDSYNSQLVKAYGKLAKGYVKTYAVPTMCVLAGTGFIIKSHVDVRKNELYYAGVAGAAMKEIDNIYSRIEEKYGTEEANYLVKGLEEKEIEFIEKDEKGQEKVVKKKVNVISPDYNGFYTYEWPTDHASYKKNALLRQAYLDSMNQYFNDILTIRQETSPKKIGHVWLQEMLDPFGIDIKEEGQFCGILKLNDPNYIGDGYVEITETTAYKLNERGTYDEISLLTFNVDGNILPTLFPKRGSR